MTKASLSLPCPLCGTRMVPRVLVCEHCRARVAADFEVNEFADLPPEELHLLRIFVTCEGRIRDMQAALGVSYPTVKSRIGALKTRLGLDGKEPGAPGEPVMPEVDDPSHVRDILGALERGEIDAREAAKRLRESS